MIGEKIKLLRNEKNISQETLGRAVGVTTSSVGLYETGARNPSYDVLKKIADYFDVSVDYLLGRTELRKVTAPNKEVEELIKVDPELLIEMCRAKQLPEEERRRIKEFAAFEIEKFLREQQGKKNGNKQRKT